MKDDKALKVDVDCPVCKFRMDRLTPVDEEYVPPQKGDFTICSKCTTVLEFIDDELTVKICKPSDTNDLITMADIAISRHKIKKFLSDKITCHSCGSKDLVFFIDRSDIVICKSCYLPSLNTGTFHEDANMVLFTPEMLKELESEEQELYHKMMSELLL